MDLPTTDMTLKRPNKPRIAILGSGGGTTARAIVEYAAASNAQYEVVLVLSNRPTAGILDVGTGYGVETCVVQGEDWEERLVEVLHERRVDLLVLAGFLKLLPANVLRKMNGKVVNTHPSLLPLFGGQGMYGARVHRAVAEAGQARSGVTLHWVDEEFDRGAIISQATVDLPPAATAEDVESRVRELERSWLPSAIANLLVQGMWESSPHT